MISDSPIDVIKIYLYFNNSYSLETINAMQALDA
jgi:hypothetical protein